MTDIRKHGFDSDMQWREHLEEIEEATVVKSSSPSLEPAVFEELASLRQEIAELRELVEAPIQHERAERPWRFITAGALFVSLIAALRLAKVHRF